MNNTDVVNINKEVDKKQVEIGLFPNIDIEDYHDWNKYPAVSSSMIRTMLNYSPLHVKAAMDGLTDKETPSLLFGSISHDILLSNEISNYVLQPDRIVNEQGKEVSFVRNGKKWEEFKTNAGNRPIVKEKELEQLIKMHDALMTNSLVKAILENNTNIELSGFWKSMNHTFLSKMRADIINDQILMFADYKTTTDASPEAFSRHFFSYGYDVQAAHYSNGLLNLTGREYVPVYIAQEKNPPYAVACFRVPNKVLENGRIKIEYAAKKFDDCFKKNEWPGYPELTEIIEMGWAASEAQTIENRLKVME